LLEVLAALADQLHLVRTFKIVKNIRRSNAQTPSFFDFLCNECKLFGRVDIGACRQLGRNFAGYFWCNSR
jgi:hypothetical protein